MLSTINFKNGQITFDNLLWLTEQDFKEQKNFFGQDLLQVLYFEKYILDVGWYNISNTKGIFIVEAIKDMNWDKTCQHIKRTQKNNKNMYKVNIQKKRKLKMLLELTFILNQIHCFIII